MPSIDYTVPGAIPPDAPAPVTDGVYTHNLAHAAEAISHLIDFFRKPRNSAYLQVVGDQLQEVEDMFWDLFTKFDLDTATGDQLRLLGKAVGEEPLGRSDTDYRAAIRVRILVNKCKGTEPELITIATLLCDGATLRVNDGVASLAFGFDTYAGVDPALVLAMIRSAKAAGVNLGVTAGGFAIGGSVTTGGDIGGSVTSGGATGG